MGRKQKEKKRKFLPVSLALFIGSTKQVLNGKPLREKVEGAA